MGFGPVSVTPGLATHMEVSDPLIEALDVCDPHALCYWHDF